MAQQPPHVARLPDGTLGALDGKHHPTFQPTREKPHPGTNADNAPARTDQEDQAKAKFSRLTHTTLYRFITGHAFTGEYTQRFYPRHTPDQVACPCGSPIETVEHVLMHCPLYLDARRKYLFANGRPRLFHRIFNHSERVCDVLCFLEETGACARPRATWDPD